MKIRYLSIAAALVTLTAANTAHAQATRTWVSGVGDDNNPCSRTAPCKTFVGAYNKTARNGEISVLDPGGYGAITIAKSITINGGGIRGSILNATLSGVTVNITDATDPGVVNLHAVDIQGAGQGQNGIRFLAGKELHVRDCTINGNNAGPGHGISFTPSAGAALFVTNTTINNNAGHGILVKPSSGSVIATAILEKVSTTKNALTGIRGEDGARISARECFSTANTNGFVGVGSAAASEMTLDNCVASGNSTYGISSFGASATVRISKTVVTNNNVGLAPLGGGTLVSFLPNQDNRVIGNPGGDGDVTGYITSMYAACFGRCTPEGHARLSRARLQPRRI